MIPRTAETRDEWQALVNLLIRSSQGQFPIRYGRSHADSRCDVSKALASQRWFVLSFCPFLRQMSKLVFFIVLDLEGWRAKSPRRQSPWPCLYIAHFKNESLASPITLILSGKQLTGAKQFVPFSCGSVTNILEPLKGFTSESHPSGLPPSVSHDRSLRWEGDQIFPT